MGVPPWGRDYVLLCYRLQAEEFLKLSPNGRKDFALFRWEM